MNYVTLSSGTVNSLVPQRHSTRTGNHLFRTGPYATGTPGKVRIIYVPLAQDVRVAELE